MDMSSIWYTLSRFISSFFWLVLLLRFALALIPIPNLYLWPIVFTVAVIARWILMFLRAHTTIYICTTWSVLFSRFWARFVEYHDFTVVYL